MADEGEFMRRLREKQAAEQARKDAAAQTSDSKKDKGHAEDPISPKDGVPSIADRRSKKTTRQAPPVEIDAEIFEEAVAIMKGQGFDEEELRQHAREILEEQRRKETGVQYNGPLISKVIERQLNAIIRSARIQQGSDSAYRQAVETVKDWTPGHIVSFITSNVDGHLKTHPAFARALRARADYFHLIERF